MSGADEARARAALLEMQLRLAQGPQIALGIESTTPERVRAAFLELTKQFHPARFGRMSTELQKLSNEVFLGIKAAHDTLMGSQRAPRPGRQTGSPVIRAEASGSMPALKATGPMPALPKAPPPPPANPGTSPPRQTQAGAPGTNPPRTPPPAATAPGTSPPRRDPTSPNVAPPPRSATPARIPLGGVAPPQRPSPTPTQSRSLTPSNRPKSGELDPQTVRPGGFDEASSLQAALDLLKSKQWSTARQALHTLAARVPQSKQYRGLLCYARGREAHVAGRGDEAFAEYQRALQLDPDLADAKQALVELRKR